MSAVSPLHKLDSSSSATCHAKPPRGRSTLPHSAVAVAVAVDVDVGVGVGVDAAADVDVDVEVDADLKKRQDLRLGSSSAHPALRYASTPARSASLLQLDGTYTGKILRNIKPTLRKGMKGKGLLMTMSSSSQRMGAVSGGDKAAAEAFERVTKSARLSGFQKGCAEAVHFPPNGARDGFIAA